MRVHGGKQAGLIVSGKLCPVEDARSCETRGERLQNATAFGLQRWLSRHYISHSRSQTAAPYPPEFKNSLLNESWLREAINQNANPKTLTLEREQINLIHGLQPKLN